MGARTGVSNSMNKIQQLLTSTEDYQFALDELVHEQKAQEAAAINNSGVQEQIKYLVSRGMSEEDIAKALQE